jgi:hypothetical protein
VLRHTTHPTASGDGDGSVDAGDVVLHQAFERRVTATAVRSGAAPFPDSGDVLGSGEDCGADRRIVHGFAVADDQRSSRDGEVAERR